MKDFTRESFGKASTITVVWGYVTKSSSLQTQQLPRCPEINGYCGQPLPRTEDLRYNEAMSTEHPRVRSYRSGSRRWENTRDNEILREGCSHMVKKIEELTNERAQVNRTLREWNTEH